MASNDFRNLPNIQLTILIGQYAQKYYLPENKDNVTNTVKNYRQFLPHFMPLVHPSHVISFGQQRILGLKSKLFLNYKF